MTNGLLMESKSPHYINTTFYYVGEIISEPKCGKCFYVVAAFDWLDSAKLYAEKHGFELIRVDYENFLCRHVYVYDDVVKNFRPSNSVFSFYGALV